MQTIYTQECMCRLARKADTWWLYKKRSCLENTQALPSSFNHWNPLQYMKEI